MEKSHELLIWDRAICTWLCYLEKMSSYVFRSCVECLWSSGGAGFDNRNSTKEGNQLFYIIKEGNVNWQSGGTLEEKSGELSGLVFPKQCSIKSIPLTYTL